MPPSISPFRFGQNYYPGRPYAPVVPLANTSDVTNTMTASNNSNPNPKENAVLGNPGKPLHAHDYALAPIKAFKDEHEHRDFAQGQGASMISEMNRHQLGEQLTSGSLPNKAQGGQNGFSRNSSPIDVARPCPETTTVASSKT